tara:strand:+ start:17 stop:211 length:195 start_codon:yes stop_codon:yes gene_type:complete
MALVGDIIFFIVILFMWWRIKVESDRIVKAGQKVLVYPGTKLPIEEEHLGSFADTAMWMTFDEY